MSPSQFRAIYSELTGDCSIADNSNSKAVDERVQLLLNTADESVLRDLRVNNGKKELFDTFWDVAEKKIEELQAAAVDYRRHAQVTTDGEVVSNFALAISARDLYEQCSKTAKEINKLTDDQIPSLSWFWFQFWPKHSFTHSALNYTGRLKIKYMMQQRTVRKFSEDDHYCSALYRYARELALRYSEFTNFITTDDKNKVKCGEPGCPISAVSRGKRVLVAKDQIIETADHDFSSITLVATVVTIHNIPASIDQSWYRGQPYVYIKINATEPSSALRNAA